MAIINIGDHDFQISGPPAWHPDGWGMDRLIVPYRGSAETEQAFIDSLEMWQESDIDDNMFLSSWDSDHHKQFPTVRLIYLGKKGGVLPPSQPRTTNPIQTAGSSQGFNTVLAEAITIEFYAVVSQLTWFTKDAKGALNTAPDPTTDPVIRSVSYFGTDYSPSSVGIDQTLLGFFQLAVTDTLDSVEVVPGKYWRNTETKTLYYRGHLTVIHTLGTRAMSIYIPGSGYTVGDVLTFAFESGSATISVVSVGPRGDITDFSITDDDIDAPIFLAILATGGTGTGAWFQFYGSG